MALPLPVLDDRTYDQLRRHLVEEIPLVSRLWTDHNPSDPGIAVLELLAAMAELMLFRLDRIPDAVTQKFLRMLVDPPEPVTVEMSARRGPAWAPLPTPPGAPAFPPALVPRIEYDVARGRLIYKTIMTADERAALEALSGDPEYLAGVARLFERSTRTVLIPAGTRIRVPSLTAVQMLDADRGVAVGHAGTIIGTEDGGRSWTLRDSTDLVNLAAVHFPDPGHGWAVGEGGAILASADGGATWLEQQSGVSNSLAEVFFASEALGWAVGSGGSILRFDGSTATWALVPSGTTEELAAVTFVGSHGWAVGAGGVVLSSTDGGSSWASQASTTSAALNAVAFVDDQMGWAVGSDATIIATQNGGTDWQPQDSRVTASLRAVHFVDEHRGWVVGTDGTIVATDNGGELWTSQDCGTSEALQDVFALDAQQAWVVTDSGAVIATADGGTTWTALRRGGLFETIGDALIEPGILSNSIQARHVEEVGPGDPNVSDGSANQRFGLLDPHRSPDDVRPILLDPSRIGTSTYNPNPDITVGGAPWQYVEDLLEVGPNDSVFTVERLTYQVRFGDGVRGLIPPEGSTIRCPRHQVVRGRDAQVAAGSLTELVRTRVRLSTLPFALAAFPSLPSVTFDPEHGFLTMVGRMTLADREALLAVPPDPGVDDTLYREAIETLFEVSDLVFINLEDAIGGRYLFDMDSAGTEGLRQRRHRERAVNVGDFVHLAGTVFNELNGLPNAPRVKRVHAQRLDDLGTIAVIVIPQSSNRWPVPPPELKRKVYRFLDKRRLITTRLLVGDPQYRRVSIKLGVAPKRNVDKAALLDRIVTSVNQYFDPIAGGADGQGWPLGRSVQRSEIFELLIGLDDVDYVESLLLDDEDKGFVALLRLELPAVDMRTADVTWVEP